MNVHTNKDAWAFVNRKHLVNLYNILDTHCRETKIVDRYDYNFLEFVDFCWYYSNRYKNEYR